MKVDWVEFLCHFEGMVIFKGDAAYGGKSIKIGGDGQPPISTSINHLHCHYSKYFDTPILNNLLCALYQIQGDG